MFVLGAACGVAGTGAVVVWHLHHGGFQRPFMEHMVINRMTRRLHLDDTQKAVLQQVITRAHDRMAEARESLQPKYKEIFDQAYDELVPVLRPDQVEELKKVRAEMEERHSHEHRGH
jgi:hypothetical protein